MRIKNVFSYDNFYYANLLRRTWECDPEIIAPNLEALRQRSF